MQVLHGIKETIFEEAFKLPENRRKFGAPPAKTETDGEGGLRIYTPNAPKLIAPILKEKNFRPIVDLEEASSVSSAAFVGEPGGQFCVLRITWMPETTDRRGEFIPDTGLHAEPGKRYDEAWAVGQPIGR